MFYLLNSSSLLFNFTVFKEFKEFKEKEAFKEIKELSFLSYYKDFKLVLCSECFLAINPSGFKAYINKHLRIFSKEERDLYIS
jgi:hypothetical protein